MGSLMKKVLVVAALVAATAFQPAVAADKKPAGKRAPAACPATVVEAEQAIRFMTDVMVVSSACQDTVYAEFRLRNQVPIRAYQKTMITHFHGNKGFDAWNTTLANQASQKHTGLPTAEICQKDAALLKTAQGLDPEGFHRYAVAQAQTAGPSCAK